MTYRMRACGRLGIACRRWLGSNRLRTISRPCASKGSIALILLFGVLPGMFACADEAQATRWVIVLTITERATGAQVEQRELDINVNFDDLGDCQSFLAKMGPIHPSENFAAALACRKVETREAAI
jgi:hypothetical protein